MDKENIEKYFNDDYEISNIDNDLYVNEEGYIIGEYSDIEKNNED
jgi:hypothetical protein